MSMFSWLFTGNKASPAVGDSSGLSRMEATRPAARRNGAKEEATANAQPGNRKGERMARRELLYSVVRDAMTRAGVLSASYKFKVLSLDSRGRQFLVMVDLSRDYGGETTRLAEIEALIAQSAKSRHDVIVTAVYWRTNEHVAVGDPNAQLKSRASQSSPASAANLAELDSSPAALDSKPAPLTEAKPLASRFEPIHSDEVAAFRSALAAGVRNPAAAAAAATGIAHGASAKSFDGSSRHGPQSYTLLTGFEDTELPDPEMRMPALSGTQYGDLN
jgi:hypothetical protein